MAKTIDEQIAAAEQQLTDVNAKLKALHKRKADQEDEQRFVTAKKLVNLMRAKNIIPDEGTLDMLVEELAARPDVHAMEQQTQEKAVLSTPQEPPNAAQQKAEPIERK
jgi:hypothetical protein